MPHADNDLFSTPVFVSPAFAGRNDESLPCLSHAGAMAVRQFMSPSGLSAARRL